MPKNNDSQDEHDPIPVKAARMEKLIRDRHALGRRLNKTKTRRLVLAARHGLSKALISRIKGFATEYSDKDLDALCALRRPSGLPLNFGHVPYLVSVRDKTARRALEIEAAENDWTPPDLSRHIQERFPTGRRGRGRRMHRPPNLVDGFGRMTAEVSRMRQRIAMMRTIINEPDQDVNQLPAELVESARKELTALREEASSAVRLMRRLCV